MANNENEHARDAEVEAQWLDEVATAFETSAREYRRLARLHRAAAGALSADDFADARLTLRRVNYRLVSILSVTDELTIPGGRIGP
jgi:hypothetical protein